MTSTLRNQKTKSIEIPDRLTFRQWWDVVGTAEATKVFQDVHTSISYMRLLRYRLKRPAITLSERIIEAANRITPGFAPDLWLMLEPLPKVDPTRKFERSIQPSAEFLAAQNKSPEVEVQRVA